MIELPAPNPEAFFRFGRQLRALAIWTAIFFAAFALLAWIYAKQILRFLLEPVEGELSPFPGGPPVFTEPTGVFSVTVELALRSGAAIAIPLFLIGLYNITPHLPTVRRRGMFIYVTAVTGLYVAGLLFVYYIMIPRGMGFLLNFGTDVAIPLITINSYFGLLKNLFLYVPLAFELPLIMWLLARAKILTYRRLMRIRKVAPLGLAIFTAIITPTVDYANFFIMYIPMVLLFETGMFLVWTVDREQGNYMWVKHVGRFFGKVRAVVSWPYRFILRR